MAALGGGNATKLAARVARASSRCGELRYDQRRASSASRTWRRGQTISGGPYDVIQNERSIVVGALVGDRVRLSFGGGSISGPIQLCLTRALSSDRRFDTPDFATVDADLNPESLRVLNLNCTSNASVVCCTVSSSLGPFFFPVQRVGDPQGKRLFDSLVRIVHRLCQHARSLTPFNRPPPNATASGRPLLCTCCCGSR